MPSPFPGMDPFIESSGLWADFHGSMVVAIRDELNARLPDAYIATLEVCVWAARPGTRQQRRPLQPDVSVREQEARAAAAAVASVAAPITTVPTKPESRKRKYVKIVDIRTREIVTVIELLSPSNKKSGDDRTAYLSKRADLLANRVSLVEIDLLRGGRRLPLGTPEPEVADYCVLVCRRWEFPHTGIWTFGLRDPLPSIPIPVAEDVSEPLLPLRACLDRAYDGGRYGRSLPYDEPLQPRPRKQDAGWVREIVAKRNR